MQALDNVGVSQSQQGSSSLSTASSTGFGDHGARLGMASLGAADAIGFYALLRPCELIALRVNDC